MAAGAVGRMDWEACGGPLAHNRSRRVRFESEFSRHLIPKVRAQALIWFRCEVRIAACRCSLGNHDGPVSPRWCVFMQRIAMPHSLILYFQGQVRLVLHSLIP